jgi:SAM-dependent methyltransferase
MHSFTVLARIALTSLVLACANARAQDPTPPFLETPLRVIERMMVLAKVDSSDFVIDLGSGDGRVVIHAAKRFGARGLGVELHGGLVELSRRNAEREGVQDRARFLQQDAFLTDLSEASVLTLYMLPEFNERLMPRILDTMRPGSRVVAHDFGIGAWPPDVRERMDVPEKNRGRGGESLVMMWIVPAKAHGRWRGRLGADAAARDIDLSIAQQFQSIEAALHLGRTAHKAALATLSADRIEISFVTERGGDKSPPLDGVKIVARVRGETMEGTFYRPGAHALPFKAQRVAVRPAIF